MRASISVVVLVWLALATPGLCQTPQSITPERIRELIADLGSEDWSTRQRAEQYLVLTPTSEMGLIEEQLRDAGMSPEQRVRLERVGFRIFQRLPRAGMGIQFADSRDDAPPEIAGAIRGFDSINVLRPGDAITHMDGEGISSVGELRSAILSRAPGQRISVTIVRDGRTVNVAFNLGAYSSLQNQRLLDSHVQLAWEWRVSRTLSSKEYAPPIVALDADDEPAAPAVTYSPGNQPSTIYQLGAVSAVAAGDQSMSNNPNAYQHSPNAAIRNGRRPDFNQPNRDQIATFEAQIADNRRQLSLLEQRILVIDQALKRAETNDDKQRLNEARAVTSARITELQRDSVRLQRILESQRR